LNGTHKILVEVFNINILGENINTTEKTHKLYYKLVRSFV